ncbi:MAG: S8 family serine peptidase [Planctomycetaceae bacterium]
MVERAQDYTTAADRITSFTQRNSTMDIVAPGVLITAAYGGGFATGTSMATPVIAGAAALMAKPLMTPIRQVSPIAEHSPGSCRTRVSL